MSRPTRSRAGLAATGLSLVLGLGACAAMPTWTPSPGGSATGGAGAAGATSEPSPTTAPTTSTPSPTPTPTPTPTPVFRKGRLQTSCEAVAHIGDSTSVGLMNPAILTKSRRIDAQYRAVGAEEVVTDILGARSVIERYEGEPNAVDAEVSILADGFSGCWVIAQGNNEAGNAYVGGPGMDLRIDLMMERLGDSPVLWPTTKTLRTSGPWQNAQMKRWNAILVDACERYPNLRVYDWAAEAKDSWFGPDQIHYTTTGWRIRAKRFADALAIAFPKGADPIASCVVRSSDAPTDPDRTPAPTPLPGAVI